MQASICNEVVKTILQRRSIRAYQPTQISVAQRDTLITCGIHAPSGLNAQQWHLSVVQDPAVISELNAAVAAHQLAQSNLSDEARARYASPDFSAVFGAPTLMWFAYPDGARSRNACFMAENIVLAAHSMGLGCCYLGGILDFLSTPAAQPLLRKMGVPQDHHLVVGLTVGIPAEAPEAKPRDFSKYTLI